MPAEVRALRTLARGRARGGRLVEGRAPLDQIWSVAMECASLGKQQKVMILGEAPLMKQPLLGSLVPAEPSVLEIDVLAPIFP